MPHDPSIGVTVSMDYVNVSGSGHMALIDQQMGRILDPNRPAWFPYAVAESKIKAAVASPDRAVVLRSMVECAPERMCPHYQEIAVGCGRWLASNRFVLPGVQVAQGRGPITSLENADINYAFSPVVLANVRAVREGL